MPFFFALSGRNSKRYIQVSPWFRWASATFTEDISKA